jgi:hypothetical protein
MRRRPFRIARPFLLRISAALLDLSAAALIVLCRTQSLFVLAETRIERISLVAKREQDRLGDRRGARHIRIPVDFDVSLNITAFRAIHFGFLRSLATASVPLRFVFGRVRMAIVVRDRLRAAPALVDGSTPLAALTD